MLVCSKCGGKNIQVLAWIDANTNEYISDYTDGDINDNWCDDCGTNVKFEEKVDESNL